ncbi:MAG: serine hydroxymethyltransferase [Gammaproteobacteria bacterium]|jgi:glycine hydroxymethyltransferase|nr:serine hydroxymethyltransferase [Gammaproteobacteria bacterium]HJN00802.1 serine hydroxymethyltransferase [Gammaproteobacteria bacterium]|tara:strand:- start:24888 stop:26141 length:1254 start_codon:yes stop_codon:yes gene_type:complete
MTFSEKLSKLDPELASAIESEQTRQEEHIELIASENYTSSEVMEIQGSVLTNKYAEGYPGRRYYGGCKHVDEAEVLAIERVKKLFSADYANVQPHSGSQANMAVYMSLLEHGDKILGMSLSDGGHLTHGAKVNFSGQLYEFISYGLNPDTGRIDYDQVSELAEKHRPKMIVAGFSAYSRLVDWSKFREIADSIDAYFMVDMAHVAGLIAGDCYPNPVPIADVTTSTTHKTLRGPRGGIILARENEEIQKAINKQVFPGTQGGPLMHVIAAKAHAFSEALKPEFKTYQQTVVKNAQAMAARFQKHGYQVVSDGTDCHLFLLDLSDTEVTGADGEKALGEANITLNKNSVPNDQRSPMVTSGLRIGSPAITTRGFGVNEAEYVIDLIHEVLSDIHNESNISSVKNKVKDLCKGFPVYLQ